VHICLVAPNDALADPRARVTRNVLERAGHRVTTVLPVEGPDAPDVIRVRAGSRSLWSRVMGRSASQAEKAERLTKVLADAAATTRATILLPTDPRALPAAVEAAVETGGTVARTPKMPSPPKVDLIDLAPSHPDLAAPLAGLGSLHTPDDTRMPYTPEPGRHRGRKVVLCYRKSEINPGKYLEAGLVRSGVEVRVETEAIDLSAIDSDTDFVIFVEGPYPALRVTGETHVPVLFWFHHGEHHLNANIRLADRYRADAVLMAHSWHLAYWLPTPVHRFPFGVATELLHPGRRLADRHYDVAMVGAKIREGGPYSRRQQLVRELDAAFPEENLGFKEQVSAQEMAELYGDARIVINEGGTRHYPITMRVLEAVGSGAVLLSDRLPGMEMLLEEGEQYELLGEDVVTDVRRVLESPSRSQQMADSALRRAMGLHTYDHRADELFEIAASTDKRDIPAARSRSGLAEFIDRDVEVQRIGQFGAPELVADLPDREVWDAATLRPERLGPGKMETVAVRADDVSGLEDLLRSARRYLYIEGEARGLRGYLEANASDALVERHEGMTRVDMLAQSYRIMPFEIGRA
jgi:Glycosyl transferases group 1